MLYEILGMNQHTKAECSITIDAESEEEAEALAEREGITPLLVQPKRVRSPEIAAQSRDALPVELPARDEVAMPPDVLLAQYVNHRRKSRILRLAALIGLLYGVVSAFANQNPHYHWFSSSFTARAGEPWEETEKKLEAAWNWQPSPMWPLSYVLCKAEIGANYDHAAGYHFRSVIGWIVFYVTSSLTGMMVGVGLGACLGALQGDTRGRESN